MQQIIEQQIRLPKVSVLLANIEWSTLQSFHPTVPGYYLTQRLSEHHSPLRFEGPSAGEYFSRVRSVGLLPPTFAVSVLPPESAFRGLSCVYDDAYFEEITGITAERWYERATDFLNLSGDQIPALMQRIHWETVQPGFGADIVIEAASRLLLVELARLAGRERAPGEAPARRVRGGLCAWQLRRIRERLAAAAQTGFPPVAEIAALCGVSEGHLMRAFKVSTGSSLHDTITQQRLLLARDLLRDSDLAVSEIALRLGFAGGAYFSTAFRRFVGMSPSRYRRRVRAGEVV
ncbi:helix-turn-helix domain-containing protein [Haliea sp. E17]|uniref:helix-turn-helix domain-containing protein n=1 Tax=Haliea sp. E17 TaxID=3401576 RepID=UPI003AAB7BC2